jgi:hypothetical protein
MAGTPKPILADGVLLGEAIQENKSWVVRGLAQPFPSFPAAAAALKKRRDRTMALAEELRKHSSNVQVKLGRGLYEALVAQGVWFGRVVEDGRTQVTVEVSDTILLKASLMTLVVSLEEAAKQHTRSESASMKARAMIGAAKQQLAKL